MARSFASRFGQWFRPPALAGMFVCVMCVATCAQHAPPRTRPGRRQPPRTPQRGEKDPGMYYYELARIHQRYGKADEAKGDYARAIEAAKTPKVKAQVLAAWGEWLVNIKEPGEGKVRLGQALGFADDAGTRRRIALSLARVCEQGEDLEGAAKQYALVLETAEDPWERRSVQRQFFEVYRRLGKLDVLLKKYQDALNKDPRDEQALRALLLLYSRVQRDHRSALRICERLVEIQPEDLALRREIADLHLKNEDVDKAVVVYRDLLKKDPQRSRFYSRRIADAYEAAKQYEKAVAWAEKYAEANESNVRAWTRYADVCVRAGQGEKAVSAYHKAIDTSKSPREKEMLELRLAGVFQTLKRDDEAVAFYKKLASSGQSPQVRQHARRRLFELYRKKGRLDTVPLERTK